MPNRVAHAYGTESRRTNVLLMVRRSHKAVRNCMHAWHTALRHYPKDGWTIRQNPFGHEGEHLPKPLQALPRRVGALSYKSHAASLRNAVPIRSTINLWCLRDSTELSADASRSGKGRSQTKENARNELRAEKGRDGRCDRPPRNGGEHRRARDSGARTN